ncbi:MAG: FAD-dependent thymidylate synthase [candidate division KSB1 bacterium]|nr:FAD-dependent thymidylate synthase [candidate division KSB1 bacterium]MDZ7295710.1 FAD-dependent thymidylate synthase [candidate division KSB1 bacterium]MDZ7385915.1 FAD-dependent thymidylate synthase [candidate division KSB1 bacterium]MDZ7392666.1 FAD-dependent thymidylate synthase [candidate division KSB1 bacterium]MDZ7412934.1 FAD-dependent thymidylate synthase [candidate division KSB1 bacterium]
MEERVLDKGFVRLVNFLGGDAAVVRAARVSVGQESKGEERDRQLIDYLLRHRHETPFEHSVFTFHIKCPIFVARQWFRHRMASYNEISGRYTRLEYEFYLPEHLRSEKGPDYQYGLLGEEADSRLRGQMAEHFSRSYELYQALLAEGVAKEHARIVLPLALYTQFYWTVNARSLMNFLSLRTDRHAQEEIREYAQAIMRIFAAKMPWTHQAFVRYYLGTRPHDE